MVVVTGPTGSGKTSTLYGGLQHIADEVRNVITLEDPVEYELAGVNQTQINPRIGLTFASGMRTVLRQDPDVVMVGEIRDGETATLAVEAAMTGHLVLWTLHTNDRIATVARLLELGVDRRLLGTSLQLGHVPAAGARGLLPLRRGRRQRHDHPRPSRRPGGRPGRRRPAERARAVPPAWRPGTWAGTWSRRVCGSRPPCRSWSPTGPRRRELRMAARAEGMRTLREDGLRLALMGVTTLEEVLRVTPEDPDLSGGDLLASLIHDGWSASGASERNGQAVSSPTG